MLRLSDFVAGRKTFLVGVSVSQIQNTVGRENLEPTHSSDISKKYLFILSRLSDFVT